MIPLTNHGFPVRSQWGRYNLPRYIYIYMFISNSPGMFNWVWAGNLEQIQGASHAYWTRVWVWLLKEFDINTSKRSLELRSSVTLQFCMLLSNRKKQLGKLLTLIWGESSFWHIWTGVRVVWPISWPILVVPGNCWRRVFGEVSQIFGHAQEFPECWGNDISEFTVFSSVNHLVSLS